MEKSAFTDKPLQNNREYYDTLLALFGEPVFLEKFLKACVRGYCLNFDQLQSRHGGGII